MFTNGSQKLQSFSATIFFFPPSDFSGYFTWSLHFKTWTSQRSHASGSNGGLRFERLAILRLNIESKNCLKPSQPLPVVRREAWFYATASLRLFLLLRRASVLLHLWLAITVHVTLSLLLNSLKWKANAVRWAVKSVYCFQSAGVLLWFVENRPCCFCALVSGTAIYLNLMTLADIFLPLGLFLHTDQAE